MAAKKRWETAARNPLAEQILKQRDGAGEVLLERLEADLADSSRYEIVASLKELESAGRGQFLVGRKGQKSRFVWAAAKPMPDKPTAKPTPDKATARPAPGKTAAKPAPGKTAAKPARDETATTSTLGKTATQPAPDATPSRATRTKPDLAREPSGALAPALSTETGAKGATRKALVPTVRRQERPKLSAHELPEPLSRPLARTPAASLQHSFHLRPGVLVTIELPADVSTSEVERLCGFLKSIPFAHDPRS
jgi:hypothetical protein